MYGVDGKQKFVLTRRITSLAKLIEFISTLKACEIYVEVCASLNDCENSPKFRNWGILSVFKIAINNKMVLMCKSLLKFSKGLLYEFRTFKKLG